MISYQLFFSEIYFLLDRDILHCGVFYHNLLKPIFLCFSTNTKPRASANFILSKKAESSEKYDKPTYGYHSSQEFCQGITKFKMHVGWSINISEFTQ